MGSAKALVQCGGKGTRLRPITYYLQKTMIPIGYSQRPLLEYVVRLLKFHGVTDITLLVNYKAEQIENYFSNGARFDAKIRYVHDSRLIKGTAGSVFNAYKKRIFNENDTLLVYYGDILTNMNLKDLMSYHKKKGAMATVALASGFEVRVGLADIEEEGKIQRFIEKPKLDKPVSIGILVFKGAAFKHARELIEERRTLDLMGDMIPYLIQNDKPVYGFVSDAFWYDIGSTEAYEKLDKKKVKDAMAFLF